mgnify:CR=1 FL=1
MMEPEDDLEDMGLQRALSEDEDFSGGIDAIPIPPPSFLDQDDENYDKQEDKHNKQRVGGAAVAGGVTGALMSVPLVAVDVTVLAIAGPIVAVAAAGGCAYMAATHPTSAKDLIKKGGDVMKIAGDNWKKYHEEVTAANGRRARGGSNNNRVVPLVEETKDCYVDEAGGKSTSVSSASSSVAAAAAAENKKRFAWPFQKEEQSQSTETNNEASVENTNSHTPQETGEGKVEKKRFAWPLFPAKKESLAAQSSTESTDLNENNVPQMQRVDTAESEEDIPDLLLADSEESYKPFCLPWAGKCHDSTTELSPKKEGENIFKWIHKNLSHYGSERKTVKLEAPQQNQVDRDEATVFDDESAEEEELTFDYGIDGIDNTSPSRKTDALFSNETELVQRLSYDDRN